MNKNNPLQLKTSRKTMAKKTSTPFAKPANTEISFYKSKDRPTARQVSATSVCEEALQNTRWIGLYRSASGQVQRENVTAELPGIKTLEIPLHAFDLEIDGQDLRHGWEWVGASERNGERGTRESVVELRHRLRAITVKIVTRLDGTPFFARHLEITNTGKAPAALSRVSPWSGLLWSWTAGQHGGEAPPENGHAFDIGYFDSLGQGSEGNFRWEPLLAGSRSIEGTNGHSGFGNPFVMLRNNLTGESAIISLAWSGNWCARFWNDPYRDLSNRPGRGTQLAFHMGPQGPAPQRVIETGETIVTPATHLGIMHCGEDEITAAWYQHLRTSVIPPRPKGKEMYSIAGRIVEEPGIWMHKEIEIAAEMGAQAFMVDAGWNGDEFGGWWERRGDWQVGKWMPNGLKSCLDLAHNYGMLFGLWMEPETIGAKSKILQEHPEWLLRTDLDREVAQTVLVNPSEREFVLDLAHPEAATFFRTEVLRVIREHQLDFFKIDYNIRIHEGGQHRRQGFSESEGWRHYETLYATFDQVRREMPEVALESCCSGGGRNDLGMMSRFHYTSVSDFSLFPRSIRAINGLTHFLPPESLCYYHNHMPPAHQKADLDTHLRVTLFSQTVFVGFGGQDANRSTAYFEKTKRYLELAKNFTMPILASSPLVYHHTPDIGLYAPADWCVLEYAAQNQICGYAGIFKLSGGRAEYRLRLRGVDASATYQVTLDNRRQVLRLSGQELMLHGLPVALDAANTSELVMYEKMSSRDTRL